MAPFQDESDDATVSAAFFKNILLQKLLPRNGHAMLAASYMYVLKTMAYARSVKFQSNKIVLLS